MLSEMQGTGGSSERPPRIVDPVRQRVGSWAGRLPGRVRAFLVDPRRRASAISARRRWLARAGAQLLRSDQVRGGVAAVRYAFLTRNGIRTLESPTGGVARNALAHNTKGLRRLAVTRSSKLVLPLAGLGVLHPEARVLSVGPRTEGELLNLVAHGCTWRNVEGLDLISYSPRVRVGDMHAMPFDDDTFDVVIVGWVLTYSDDKRRAAAEILRVVRPGGTIAVGIAYTPKSNEQIVAEKGYLPGSAERLRSLEDLGTLFGDGLGQQLVAVDRRDPDRPDDIILIFRATGR